MVTLINMENGPSDVEIIIDDDDMLRLRQDSETLRLTYEGARSLAFTLIGITELPSDSYKNMKEDD